MANTLCVTETLTNVQDMLGTLSLNNLDNIVAEIASLDSFPASVTCTDCIKESYNLINTAFPDQSTNLTTALETQCGTTFVGQLSPLFWALPPDTAISDDIFPDGQMPSDITETAKPASG